MASRCIKEPHSDDVDSIPTWWESGTSGILSRSTDGIGSHYRAILTVFVCEFWSLRLILAGDLSDGTGRQSDVAEMVS